jgi:hypothetical protein
MKIPEDAIIPESKLTKYLLIFKQRNDKSQYLAQGGFFLENWQSLNSAIKDLIHTNEAIQDITDEYGTYYQVNGILQGINQTKLPVITIWIQRKADQKFYFVTLKPNRGAKP